MTTNLKLATANDQTTRNSVHHRLSNVMSTIRQRDIGRQQIRQGARTIDAYSWWGIAGPLGDCLADEGLRLRVDCAPAQWQEKLVTTYVTLRVVAPDGSETVLGGVTGEAHPQVGINAAVTMAVKQICVIAFSLPDESDPVVVAGEGAVDVPPPSPVALAAPRPPSAVTRAKQIVYAAAEDAIARQLEVEPNLEQAAPLDLMARELALSAWAAMELADGQPPTAGQLDEAVEALNQWDGESDT